MVILLEMLVNCIVEHGLDIGVVLGRHFHELVAYFRSQLHPLFSRDLLFMLPTLVGDQPLRAFLFSLILYALSLFMHFLKGFDILAIVNQEEYDSSLIKNIRKGFESLLTRSIPDLQIDEAALILYLFLNEISSNCRLIFLPKSVFNESLDQGCFATLFMPHQQEFQHFRNLYLLCYFFNHRSSSTFFFFLEAIQLHDSFLLLVVDSPH